MMTAKRTAAVTTPSKMTNAKEVKRSSTKINSSEDGRRTISATKMT